MNNILPYPQPPKVGHELSESRDELKPYRSRIYQQYASIFQETTLNFNTREAEAWGRPYQYYFRGWLPPDKDSAMADLGCGGGNLLHFLKQRGYARLVGVDVSPEQARLARQVTPEIQQASVFDFLGRHKDSFDLITGLDIVEHFSKDEVLRFLDGCYRALSTGGRLILQTPNAETPWGNSVRYGDFTHEVCFSPNALAHLLKLCGFNQIELRELGPVPLGISGCSTLRYLLWQGLRQGLKVYNLIETGRSGSGIFTRVFAISAIKL